MTELLLIVLLIGIGISLILVEVLLLPGVTFVGLIGGLLMIGGAVASYYYFGRTAGHFTIAGEVTAIGLSIFLSFKYKTWKNLALEHRLENRVNDETPAMVNVGDTGVAVSTLRPVGKAEINNQLLEVTTYGNYLEPNSPIKVIKISNNSIFVEPINNS
jgi:membrane-bound ClpP family serine protease